MNKLTLETRRRLGPVVLAVIIIALLYQDVDRVTVRVLEINNSAVVVNGLVQSGEQSMEVEILGGKFHGQTAEGVNMLNGSLEQDKMFVPGDKAMAMVSYQGDQITHVMLSDHWRIGWEIVMIVAYVLLLILFAGRTGLRALLAFSITILTMWKILVPFHLRGWNPVLLGLAVTLFLTLTIIVFVFGFGRRSLAASLGAFLGILVTAALGAFFTSRLNIHGAVMAYSESLLYSGYGHLNLTQIFMASIFIGASGAIMDLSVDITSAVDEVVRKRPDLGWKEAVRSGLNVGRNAMGTQTTTLLLAYSGGYIGLLMVFMAQGTPVQMILNYKYVAAEIIHTIIGSFGLVTVAPFTALCAGILLTRKEKTLEHQADGSEP